MVGSNCRFIERQSEMDTVKKTKGGGRKFQKHRDMEPDTLARTRKMGESQVWDIYKEVRDRAAE